MTIFGVNVFLILTYALWILCAMYLGAVGKWLVHRGIIGDRPRGPVTEKQWLFGRAFVRYKLRYYGLFACIWFVLSLGSLACYILFGRG